MNTSKEEQLVVHQSHQLKVKGSNPFFAFIPGVLINVYSVHNSMARVLA